MGQAAPIRHADGNLLLAALPPADYEMVASHLHPVALEPKQALYDPEKPIDYVYFVDSGMVSLLSVLSDRTGVEAASTGRDGMVGMPVFQRADRMAGQAVVQLKGSAQRMSVDSFRACVRKSETLEKLLHLYSACLFMLAAQSIACISKHEIDRRLARWLLHAADQSGQTQLGLTHLILVQMLGVRRSTVTIAAGTLRKAGLIQYTKKHVTIVDRPGLEQASCECYHIIRSTYDRLLFGTVSHNPTADMESSRGGVSTIDAPHPEDSGR